MRYADILAEAERLAEAGKEKECEDFILEHYTKLPEEVQKKVLMALASETLEAEAGEQAIEKVREEGIKALEALRAMREAATVQES